METEPKQLKLIKGELAEKDGSLKGRKEKKEKERANMWFVLVILVISVLTTIIFYFSGGLKTKDQGEAETVQERNGLFGEPKVYEF